LSERQQGEQARGFVGLESLASTISPEPTFVAAPSASGDGSKPGGEPSASKSLTPLDQVREKPGFWTGSRKTWAVVIAGAGILAYLNFSPQSPSYSNANYAPASTNRPAPPPTPPTWPSGSPAPMKVPPAGRDQALSLSEIKYCLAERIRIEGTQAIIDRSRDAHIRNFNSRVDDYNARCASYRYRPSDMTLARSEVDAMRASLQSQVAEQVRAWR